MPPPLSVLGFMYVIVAIAYIVSCLYAGFWRGMWQEIKKTIYTNLLYIIIVVSLGLFSVLILDVPVAKLCKLMYTVKIYSVVNFLSSMAEGWFIGGLLIMFGLVFQIFKQQYNVLVCKISLMAMAYAGLINLLLKGLISRQRPSIGLDNWKFFQLFLAIDKHAQGLFYAYNSMPSGHTITAVAALAVVFLAYKNTLLRGIWVLIGVVVGFSRIYTINHWLSDVLIATLCGIVVGVACYKINILKEK